MKKSVLLLSIVLATLFAAQSIFALTPYMGIEGGYAKSNVTSHNTGTLEDKIFQLNSPITPVTNTTSMKGYLVGVFAGISQKFGWFNLAGEISFFYNPAFKTTIYAEDPNITSPNKFGVKEKWGKDFELSILPGINLPDDFLLYTRVGLAYSQFSSTAASKIGTGPNGLANFNKWLRGGVFGAGIQKTFPLKNGNAWSIRGEYDYIAYGKVNGSGSSAADPNTIYHINTQYRNLNQQRFLVGLSYDF